MDVEVVKCRPKVIRLGVETGVVRSDVRRFW
jgi:hypothetical protein